MASETKNNTKKETNKTLQPGVKDVLCVSLLSDGTANKLQCPSLEEVSAPGDTSLITWINVTVGDINKDAEKVANHFGFETTLVSTLLSEYLAAYEDTTAALGLMIPAVSVYKLELEINPLLILIKKNLILTIHGEGVRRLVKFARYADIFLKKIPQNTLWNDRISIVLMRIINENNEKNFEGLRNIEEQGDEIGKFLSDPKSPRDRLGLEIYTMKHALITYLNILWASLDVMNSLRYGDAELITDDEKLLVKFGLLAEDVTRQISLSEHMSEVLASGLEVLQSIYNNQLQILNNRMAMVMTWLTVLGTAVLVPNTIATIMSNPAFSMGPGDVGWYSALLVVATVVSTLLAYWWIKTRGWIPERID